MPPVGFKRSRAIWDETRRPHLTTQQTIHAWIAAIAYEVQPIRLSDSNRRQFFRSIHKWILLFLSGIQSLPGLVKSLASFLASRTRREWAIAGAIFGYYLLVRWIHDILEAGPMVVIVTALVAIFTIGLGDDDNPTGPSAYSVFNRGFERLLGSVDADALLAQHIGGGAGGLMMMNNNNNDDNDDVDDVDGGRIIRRRAVRPRPDGAARGEQDDGAELNLGRNRDANDNNVGDGHRGDDNNIINEQNGDNNVVNNRARKSGKKARRRNLDQRREIQRQREAAIRMGMDHEETIEMQMLIEAQIAAENNNRND